MSAMSGPIVFYCADCGREYPVGPRQTQTRVYELALRHAVNVHHKVGLKAHDTIQERMSSPTEKEG